MSDQAPGPERDTDEVTQQDAGMTGRAEGEEVPHDRVPRDDEEE